jgi:hypothetical protein
MNISPSNVIAVTAPTRTAGWGIDADLNQRPGVPAQQDPPRPVAGLPDREPPRQTSGPTPLLGPSCELTPVYSTALPPRGLSGWMRRIAYSIPDYRARRWLLLLTADRVDALEHGRRLPLVVAAGAIAGLGFWLTRRRAA